MGKGGMAVVVVLLLVLHTQVVLIEAVQVLGFLSGTCDPTKKTIDTQYTDSGACRDIPPVDVPMLGGPVTVSARVHCDTATSDSAWTATIMFGHGCSGATMGMSAGTGNQQCVPPVSFLPDELTVKIDCGIDSAPAVYSSWTSWSSCSATCGGGVQTRSRHLLTAGSNPQPTTESRACGSDPCPVDCQLSEWSPFSSCSASCGPGTRTRTRTVTVPAAHDGKSCDALSEHESCNAQPCPIDCVVDEWSTWSACDQPCGGGVSKRTREIKTAASLGGIACPSTLETKTCNTQECPVDCAVSEWGEFSLCSKTCGGGTKTRKRTTTTKDAHGGKTCPHLEETEPCGETPCPVDCKMSEWSKFGDCSHTCGQGTQTRKRTVEQADKNGGKPCTGALEESQSCFIQECPVDCQMSAWSNFSECSVSCGGGVRERVRTVTVPAKHSGEECGVLNETTKCNTFDCPVDCVTSAWSTWGPCSKSCGKGERSRTRTIIQPAAHGGVKCGTLELTEMCNMEPCASSGSLFGGSNSSSAGSDSADCQQSAWSSWSECSVTCGNGTKTRTRTTIAEPGPNGKPCGESMETRHCPTNTFGQAVSCPKPGACKVSSWSDWSNCSVSCGNGTKIRIRTIVEEPAPDGEPCPKLSETAECPTDTFGQLKSCKAHKCVLSAWSSWSPCSQTCGPNGTKTRTRTIVVPPDAESPPCGNLVETAHCPTNAFGLVTACPKPGDCHVSSWSEWSNCSTTCGPGIKSRTRTIVHNAKIGGRACPSLSELANCTVRESCTQNCHVSAWHAWSKCSKSCGGGVQMRSRTVLKAPSPEGEPCPNLTATRECAVDPCGSCQYSGWTDWSDCSRECGGGVKNRTRVILHEAGEGGRPCNRSHLLEERHCNTEKCDGPCQTGPWSNWDECSATCGGGVQTRTREIVEFGAHCPHLHEDRNCSTQECPAACETSEWSEWSACSATCGNATKSRVRTMTKPAAANGACKLKETKACEDLPDCPPPTPTPEQTAAPVVATPVKCPMSPWSKCSKPCGGGEMTRVGVPQVVPVATTGSAADCEPEHELAPCNTHTCPVGSAMCEYQPYGEWTPCRRVCAAPASSRYGVRSRLSRPTPTSPFLCHLLKQEERCDMPMEGTILPGTTVVAVKCIHPQFVSNKFF